MKRRLINPPGTEKTYQRWQYSQAVRVGDTIWVSGQVGMEKSGPAEGIEAQTRIAMESLRRVLEEAGATLGDVVELVTYHTTMADMPGFAKVKAEFFPSDYPAWTAVGVPALAVPGILLEVRATAVAGSAAVG
jgi:enamine deaminase RidA (YjgF/YER057c/UK114 family)